MNTNLRQIFLPQNYNRTLKGCFSYLPTSSITSFRYLSQYFSLDEQIYDFDDISEDFLRYVGYAESEFLTSRESNHMIARARKHQSDAQYLYTTNKEVLRTDRVVRSDLALRKLHNISHTDTGKRVPWGVLVPEGTSAQENIQQRILYAYSKVAEKAETLTELDSLAILKTYDKIKTPSWWNISCVDCKEEDYGFEEHTDCSLFHEGEDSIITYLVKNPDSFRYAYFRRLGMLRMEDVVTGTTILEKWSKGQNADIIMKSIIKSKEYIATIPSLTHDLYDFFGIPLSVQAQLERLVNNNETLPTVVNYAPVSKYTEHLNLTNLPRMKGVTTDATMIPRIYKDKANATAAAYYSMFFASSDKYLTINYLLPSILAFHGVTKRMKQHYLDTLPSEKLNKLYKQVGRQSTKDLYSPIPSDRLDPTAKRNWDLFRKPEMNQWHG
jgi:hypothetical protein